MQHSSFWVEFVLLNLQFSMFLFLPLCCKCHHFDYPFGIFYIPSISKPISYKRQNKIRINPPNLCEKKSQTKQTNQQLLNFRLPNIVIFGPPLIWDLLNNRTQHKNQLNLCWKGLDLQIYTKYTKKHFDDYNTDYFQLLNAISKEHKNKLDLF